MNSTFRVFLFKQKTAYEMRISDWSSDGCSSDLRVLAEQAGADIGEVVLRDGNTAAQRQGQRTDLQPGQHKCLLHCSNPLHGAIKRTRPKWPGGPMITAYYAASSRKSVRYRWRLRLRAGGCRSGARGSAVPSAPPAWCCRPPSAGVR